MKKILFYTGVLAVFCSIIFGCKRESDYILVTPSPFISNFDLKKLFKNADVQLNSQNLNGANSVKGVVISDHANGNMPAGLIIIQNARVTGSGIDSLRGIAINIGADAAKYIPGDSVHVKIDGSTLGRVNGILQLTGISGANVTKIASGRTLRVQAVSSDKILANPGVYESTLVTVSKAVLEPEPATGETFVGNKILNDGFGKITLHTETGASFANKELPFSGNFTGIPLYVTNGNQTLAQILMRTYDDVLILASTKPSPVIITGYLTDPQGSDAATTGQYEYIQFMATKDIDFAVTPFSVVTTNNAGSTNAFPADGWAIGGVRTYKINLTSGTVKKGQFFYVGGSSKLIWGAGSTNIASANWIAAVNYAVNDGADFGTATTNLLANSGNFAGIAVFSGTKVDKNTIPLDVICYGGAGGNVYSAGPPEVGYRITNTDYYGTINPLTRQAQDYYGSGSNTTRLGFPVTQASPAGGSFASLGGVYDAQTGRWTTGRILKSITMTLTSPLSILETGTGITTVIN